MAGAVTGDWISLQSDPKWALLFDIYKFTMRIASTCMWGKGLVYFFTATTVTVIKGTSSTFPKHWKPKLMMFTKRLSFTFTL